MGPEEIEDVMAAEALSESEILAKANKALPDDYTPSDDEEYMNERQQQFFRKLLIEWKHSLHTEAGGTLQNLADAPLREPFNLFVQGGWTICASPPGVGGGSHGTPNALTSESCGGGQT